MHTSIIKGFRFSKRKKYTHIDYQRSTSVTVCDIEEKEVNNNKMLATLYPKLPILLEQDLENVALTGKSAPLSPIWRNTPLPPLDLMKDSVRKRRRRRATTPSQMINPLEEGMKELRQEKAIS
jgi:hypothetical protein